MSEQLTKKVMIMKKEVMADIQDIAVVCVDNEPLPSVKDIVEFIELEPPVLTRQ